MNDTNEYDNKTTKITGILTVSGSSVCLVINILFIIVCSRALRKTFHHLLILFLLFGDLTTSLSTCLSAVARFHLRFFENNVPACTFIVIVMSYGLLLSYICLFLLCLNRVLTLKTNNFGGQQKKLEKRKYSIVCFVVVVSLVYQVALALMTPREKSLKRCSVHNLYGKYSTIYLILFVIPVTFLLMLLVALYLFGSVLIYKTFFTQGVSPESNAESADKNECSTNKIFQNKKQGQADRTECWVDEDSRLNQRKTIIHQNKATDKDRNNSFDVIDSSKDNSNVYDIFLVNVENRQTENQIHELSSYEYRASLTDRMKTNSVTENERCDVFSDLFSDDSDENVFIDFEAMKYKTHDAFEPKKIESSKEENNTFTEDKCNLNNPNVTRDGTWEIRAFVTCVVIAVQSILLTGPIIVVYWIDILSDTPVSTETKFLCFFPYFLNILSNPILYIWRIPEIRLEFKCLLSSHLKLCFK